MRTPELDQLITELGAEKQPDTVMVQPQSKMVVIAEADDTEERHVFNARECQLLLSSADTVGRLFEALDYPDEAFVELYGLIIEREVMEELEKFSSSIDEL
jgi:hypothetical protein